MFLYLLSTIVYCVINHFLNVYTELINTKWGLGSYVRQQNMGRWNVNFNEWLLKVITDIFKQV